MGNSAAVAKSRAVYGSFLKKEDYDILMNKSSIGAAVAYLRTKPRYAAAFADVDEAAVHREQVEELISKSVFDNYIRICKFSGGSRKGIARFHIKKLEAQQLSKAVIAVSTGNQVGFYGNLPYYLMDYLSFNPAEAAEAKSFSALLEVLKDTGYYKFLKPVMSVEKPDVNGIIIAINACYMKWAFGEINSGVKGKAKEQLKNFFLRKADIDNLLLCYRLRTFFGKEPEEIKSMLSPYHYRLRPAEIDEALKSPNPDTAIRELFLKKKLAENISRREDCPEIAVNAADFKYFRRRLALSTNEIEALYSLMVLAELEAANLFRIIEGIRYGLPSEEIEKFIV